MASEEAMDVDYAETADAAENDVLREQFEKLELSPLALAEKLQEFQLILQNPRDDEQAVKIKEQCIYRLAHAYTEAKQLSNVVGLLKTNGSFFSALPKARTAKIVRNILNIVASVPDTLAVQVELCEDIVAWCRAEKRTFLRQRIEARLAALLLQQRKAVDALKVIDALLPELRKLDDKQMLTEVHLTEARVYHALQNLPKAKASLTASRTAANAIYVVPLLQAEIDQMSGMLLAEEGDYNTAFSYFLEAFDAFDSAATSSTTSSPSSSTSSAVDCLKYMVLCKILKEAAHEVPNLLASKIGMKHAGLHLEAMAAVAKAAKASSLEDFQAAVAAHRAFLLEDDLIAHHLELLYEKMLEANLLRILHPYEAVQIAHIAKLIKLDEAAVVSKLSQMILDHKLLGILDQGKGHLIIYASPSSDAAFSKGAEIISNMSTVVEALSARTRALGKAGAPASSVAAVVPSGAGAGAAKQ